MPMHLTPFERAIIAVLQEASGPMKGRQIYAAVTGTPLRYADDAKVHIRNMRKKGCKIGSARLVGYWLMEVPVIEMRQPIQRPKREHAINAEQVFRALDIVYSRMAALS